MEKLLTCSLTKEPTSEPLICTKTGLIFDKSTITNFFGDARIRFCPITQIQIKLSEDFRAVRGLEGPSLGIKSSVSRLSAANKILENFRDVLLEAKTNQKTVNLLKKKLAASLRQQDASIRVIRRLIEERDDARRLLIDKRYEMTETGVEKMEIEESDENLRDEIKVSAIRLNKVRKELDKLYNRSPFAGLGIDQMTDSAVVEHGLEGIGRSSGTFIYCHPFDCDYYVLGVTQPSKPGSGQEAENEGILAHSVLSEASREQWSFSELKFFNFEEKKIFDLRDKFLEPRRIDTFTESSFYSDDEGFGFVSTLNDGKIYGGVVDFETAKIKQAMLIQTNRRYLALQEHPLSHILALLDDSRELSLLDLKRQRAVFEATIEDDLELTGLSCHPDGKLIALSGTNSQVHFFDLNSKQVVITLETSQGESRRSLFSLNGYNFLSVNQTDGGDTGGQIADIFDLRVTDIVGSFGNQEAGTVFRNIQFDKSGHNLLIQDSSEASKAKIYSIKEPENQVVQEYDFGEESVNSYLSTYDQRLLSLTTKSLSCHSYPSIITHDVQNPNNEMQQEQE